MLQFRLCPWRLLTGGVREGSWRRCLFVEVGSRPGELTAVTGRDQITQAKIVLLEKLACVGRRRGEKNEMALKPAMCESKKSH